MDEDSDSYDDEILQKENLPVLWQSKITNMDERLSCSPVKVHHYHESMEEIPSDIHEMKAYLEFSPAVAAILAKTPAMPPAEPCMPTSSTAIAAETSSSKSEVVLSVASATALEAPSKEKDIDVTVEEKEGCYEYRGASFGLSRQSSSSSSVCITSSSRPSLRINPWILTGGIPNFDKSANISSSSSFIADATMTSIQSSLLGSKRGRDQGEEEVSSIELGSSSSVAVAAATGAEPATKRRKYLQVEDLQKLLQEERLQEEVLRQQVFQKITGAAASSSSTNR
jgi:hypothetical protein